jgi:CRISPR-associated protein Cas5 subtype I-A
MIQPYRAFIVQARAPTFSIRQPQSYQVGVSFPLPQPSTLTCALAYAAGLTGVGQSDLQGDEYVKELVESVLRLLVRATVKPVAPLTNSSVTLSRVRALEEDSSEKVVEAIRRGRKITDAMVREYYSGRLTVIYVFRSVSGIDKVYSWLYLLGRLGDTESLISVERVEEATIEHLGSEEYVDTYTPVEWVESYGEGFFSLIRMCREELCAKPVRSRDDYERCMSVYIVPMTEEWVKGSLILKGAKVRIRTKRGYTIWGIKGISGEARIVLPGG